MRGLRDLGLVAQAPDALPHRPEHQQSVASLACNVFPHAAVASLACKVSPFTTAKQSFLRSLPWKLALLSEPLHAAVRHWRIRGLSYSCIMIVLYCLLSRSLALSCLSCPAISSSLSMPPLCSGQVGHPRLQPLGLLLLCRQGRSQVCGDSL